MMSTAKVCFIRCLSAFLVYALAGCASSPPARYFLLDEARPAAVGAPDGLRVVIVRVQVPELIDRPQLVVRDAGQRVELSEQNQWAEPLRAQIPRLLARDIGQALNSAQVSALPGDGRENDADFRLSLTIERLAAQRGGPVLLEAGWRIQGRDGQSRYARCHLSQGVTPHGSDTVSADDYPELVAAQGQSLHRLAAAMASSLTGRHQNCN